MGSVSREIQFLRECLQTNTSAVMQKVMNGSLLLLVVVDQVDEIDALLRLKADLNIPRVAIKGGPLFHYFSLVFDIGFIFSLEY
jgi:hypothetical protein